MYYPTNLEAYYEVNTFDFKVINYDVPEQVKVVNWTVTTVYSNIMNV